MTTGAIVNVRFHCLVAGCDCHAMVAAQMIVRSSGQRTLEHTNRCPTCAHKLSRHRPGTQIETTSPVIDQTMP